ncbi:chemotaxis protein CheB [Pleurocapsales cyanobacterium LEGE 06147]|nr:chemotaxis protein CheB [Pleurocapsales cyanobacterium LEGE 06147]
MLGRIIVIGASAGGVETLRKLVAGLPADLPAAVFVVIHISPHSNSVLPKILSRAGSLEALHPTHGEIIQPGRIYVAPPDYHMLLKPGQIQLTRGAKENNSRPAIDVLFRTAARAYDSQVIGVLLSGLLDDGTAGLWTIKQQGGVVIVQDPDEALYPSMPRNAIENVDVDLILPVLEITKALVNLAQKPPKTRQLPRKSSLEIESDPAELEPVVMQNDKHSGTPSAFACPDCGGVLWEAKEGNLIRFRCRIGHAFSVESLMAEQSDQLEEALWSALRALEEMANIRRRLAQRAVQSGHSARAQKYNVEAEGMEQRAELIRQAILNNTSELDKTSEVS